MEKKKISLCITKSGWGGAQRYVAALAEHMAKQDVYEAVVVCGENPLPGEDVLASRMDERGIPVVRIAGLVRDVRVGGDIKAFAALIRFFRTERPQVVHLNSSKMGLIGAIAARVAGVPKVVFTVHGWPFNEPRSVVWRALAWLGSWVTSLLAHVVIAVSEADTRRARVLPFISRKCRTIHNGVDAFSGRGTEAARTELLSRYAGALSDIGPETVWIGSMAELNGNKNVSSTLLALGTLRTQGEDIAYVHFGTGEQQGELRAQVAANDLSSRVLFAGFVADAGAFLPALDIFVLPSKKEGLPYALLEAGAAGKAVVATDVGGIPEIIHQGESGLLVPASDQKALEEALRSLAHSAERRTALGQALRARVRTFFSKETMLRTTVETYGH